MKRMIAVLVFIMMIAFLEPIVTFGEENKYQVIVIKETGNQIVEAFDDFLEAKIFFHNEKDFHNNLGVYYKDKLLMVKNGLALIPNNDCTQNFQYHHVSDNFRGYTNGCYGVDALYLDTNDSGTRFKFELAGVQAWGNASEMTLIPIEEVTQLTSYYVKEDTLYHQIKTNMNSSYYGSTLNLGPTPDFLSPNQIYLSYNGHYFYEIENFDKMVANLRNNNYLQAVNDGEPYYNYYLMLPHRSQTRHNAMAIKEYFQERMGYRNAISYYFDEDRNSVNDILTQSQYFGFETSFFEYEGVFGANALMMLALSMNESASGRSSLAFNRNNLFGHAAYDSDVESNAQRYLTISASVYSHAKNYISGSYANPNKFQYHGSHFGDKSSGMNVAYASDPYWSEKAVQYYISLDKHFDYLDYNFYAIGIKTSDQKVPIYGDDFVSILYETSTDRNLSFIILAEHGNMYKVQIDPAHYLLDNKVEYSYDYQANVGYLNKEYLDIVLNEDQIKEVNYINVIYNSGDGIFKNGLRQMSAQVSNYSTPLFEEPIKKGYLFSEWEIVKESEYAIYCEAVYAKIESIEIIQTPPLVIELDNRISLKGGLLSVKLENQEAFEVPITTSMVSNYSIREANIYEVIVQYGGASTTYQMEVSAALDASRIYLNETAAKFINDYDNGVNAVLLKEELIAFKEMMVSEFYPRLSLEAVHKLDVMMKENDQGVFSVVIHKNEVDLSVSGIHLSTDYSDSFSKKWFKDTIEIKMKNGVNSSSQEELEKIALAHGYKIEHYFSLDFTKNGKMFQVNGPLVFTMNIPVEENNRSYQVFQLVENEVISLHSATYKNTVKFKCFGEGEFVLVSRATNNIYDASDIEGNSTRATNGFNYHQMKQWIMIIGSLVLSVLLVVIIFLIKSRKGKQVKKEFEKAMI